MCGGDVPPAVVAIRANGAALLQSGNQSLLGQLATANGDERTCRAAPQHSTGHGLPG
eukprot:CAMPEP_0117695598 /NCGR_PEP_ID=MMETSP0804-20121206/28220_1 /TAXON_ID=1074897 /ORGANISM="Tetraselmis astigmatica, Strain CCMP880" /LENGTH=56 /DNA_ID=CAMNT_0005509671 /DNA_START=62 /DNA_END=232 /DNA_ORIENTATION=+